MAETDAPPPLHLRLFGPFDARLHGEPLPPLRSRRGHWLLALLVLRHDREVSREWLAGTLWPDNDTPQALSSLRRSLTDLRHALGDQAERLHSPTPHTLRLDLTGARADVAAFDAAVGKGGDAALVEAVGLYRGPLLEGCEEEWLLPEREERAAAYLAALERLAERAQTLQDHTQAVHYLRLAVAADPLRETAQRGLMRSLAQQGALTAVTQVYRDFRLLLRREMNADPDPETTALYQQLRADARRRAQRPGPEPDATPQPGSVCAPPRRLPSPLTHFVGRRKEIEQIVGHLEEARIVSLVGTGGIGKTRLAIQAAEEAAEDYTDGVWFVDLSPLADAALVSRAVASVLELREQADRPLLETLSGYLGSKSLLLVLDNCEHVVEACAHLAERLATCCPRLRLLTTTRQSLGVAGERVYRVPPLSMPEPKRLPVGGSELEALSARYEAIQLFVERASAAIPTFALTPRSAPSTVQICRRLDGIPLALELAASRVNVLTVEEISRRLDDRFRLLTQGSRTGPRRQQTLRAAIDWSYDLLSEKERTLLRRLAVFAGGWVLEAAEQVCSEEEEDLSLASWEMLDLLAQLVDRSMVVVEGSEVGAVRYRMMESIREYALERLRASGEEESLRDRHRRYYLELSEQAEPHLAGSEQAAWLEQLDTEHDNLRAVLTWSVDADTQVRMTGALWRLWWIRGYYTEGRAWLRAALTYEGDATPAFLLMRAKAIGGAAVLAGDQHDFPAALTYFEELLAIRRRLGDKIGLARALNNLALCLFHQERCDEAQPLLEESLALKREANDRRGIAQSLGNLGMIACVQGALERAIAYHEECREISRELGDWQSASWAASNLGDVALRQGDLEKARSCFQEGLRIGRELQDRRNFCALLSRLGAVACLKGEAVRGVRLLGASYVVLDFLGVQLLPAEEREHAEIIANARRHLDASAYAAAWNEGRALPTDQAVAYALDETDGFS